MLTPKQYKLLMFIDNFIKENGCCPSFEEMKQAVGIKSKSGIHALIEELIERDFVKKLPHKARALEVLRTPRFKPREIIEEEKKDPAGAAHRGGAGPAVRQNCGRNADCRHCRRKRKHHGAARDGQPRQFLRSDGRRRVDDRGRHHGRRHRHYPQSPNCRKWTNRGGSGGQNRKPRSKCGKRKKDEVWLKPCNQAYEIRKLAPSRVRVQGILSGILRRYR